MQLQKAIRMEKSAYREKIKGSFTSKNMKKTWDGILLMSGHAKKPNCRHFTATNIQYANDLKNFYNRFDEHDFSAELHNLQTSLSTTDCNIAVSV